MGVVLAYPLTDSFGGFLGRREEWTWGWIKYNVSHVLYANRAMRLNLGYNVM